MNFEEVSRFVQGHFTDGLTMVIGSGLSAAEGLSGMVSLANHLQAKSESLDETEKACWAQISIALDEGKGLESALIEFPPSEVLESWIMSETVAHLLPQEREALSSTVNGLKTLKLTSLLRRVLVTNNSLPIITTNYDRLVEMACEMAGLHVDTTTLGSFAGEFDHQKSCMSSCIAIKRAGRTYVLEHRKRAVVLKPHGSFDWYRIGDSDRCCSIEIDADRLIITPGLNKYRAGYNSPFDRQRELANSHIDKANRLLVVGYGFNDDHLQTHLLHKIRSGTPTLIATRTKNPAIEEVVSSGANCICLSKDDEGTTVSTASGEFAISKSIWDIADLAEECLK